MTTTGALLTYSVRCPHCHGVHSFRADEIWYAGGPRYPEPGDPQRCPSGRGWFRLVFVGADHELDVEACTQPQLDPPDILGTGI